MNTRTDEFEIKLAFPKDKLVAIEKFLISKGADRRQRLQAGYLDTDLFHLANAGIALRVRKEGRQWVQTLKAGSAAGFERLEHNVILKHVGPSMPHWDITVHQGHPAYEQLLKTLQKYKLDPSALRLRYQTDIWRRSIQIKARGAVLEYALDQGVIKAEHKVGEEQATEVCELEIELISGDKQAVVTHAKTMVRRFGAYIDTRSKSQRGFCMSVGIDANPPTRASAVVMKDDRDCKIASTLIHSCLQQILPNASEINASIMQFDEYVHQLRVGLRRLKTAMKSLALIQVYLSEAELKELEKVFNELGLYRDLNFLDEKLRPALAAVDAPAMNLSSVQDLPHPREFLRDKNFQLFCLSIVQLAITMENIDPQIKQLKRLILLDLDKVQKDTKKVAAEFMTIEDELRHKLRKRLKRLRYTLEFFKDFCDAKRYKPYLKGLTRVSEALGHYNDLCVALEQSGKRLSTDNNILFALGWLKAEQTRVRLECAKELKAFYAIKKAW